MGEGELRGNQKIKKGDKVGETTLARQAIRFLCVREKRVDPEFGKLGHLDSFV